jgi:hypothetical protein
MAMNQSGRVDISEDAITSVRLERQEIQIYFITFAKNQYNDYLALPRPSGNSVGMRRPMSMPDTPSAHRERSTNTV